MKKIFVTAFLALFIILFPAVAAASNVPPVPNPDYIVITAELQGLNNMHVGVEVRGRVLFEIEGAQWAQEIYEEDFRIWNLPSGLTAEEARRIGSQLVEVRITGTPTFATGVTPTISTPARIHTRNIRHGQLLTALSFPVERVGDFRVGTVERSAVIWPESFTFDINPDGSQHRDIFVQLGATNYTLVNIRYGRMNLVEETHFIRHLNNRYMIRREFLSRMAVGEWELEFVMNRGANPTVRMIIIDTSREEAEQPYEPVGPPIVPPDAPRHPDESFMYLTGGIAVDLNRLHWDLNRARVTPEFHNSVATATVRADALDYLAWNRPGESFQIMTPHARIRIPADILNTIHGARAAIIYNELANSQVDLRITIADHSDDERSNFMFEATYPDGEILTSLIELRMELVCIQTEEIILTAQEFSRPVELSFVVMDNAGHLRPAGILFRAQWIEFVPYGSPSPNEVVLSTIFPGIVGVIHNRVHFEDIYSTHWGFVQSYTAAYSGLLVPMTHLHPDTPITRGEFAQLLSSVLQLPRANANISGFTDVPPPNVFFDGVSRLFEAGLLGPYVPGSRFYPNAIITREEMAAIIGMAITLNEPVRQQNPRPLFTFTDAADFTFVHMQNVQTAVDFGAMIGYPDNSFRPLIPATRIYALEATINLARILGVLDEI